MKRLRAWNDEKPFTGPDYRCLPLGPHPDENRLFSHKCVRVGESKNGATGHPLTESRELFAKII
jgi:hypothetical protein